MFEWILIAGFIFAFITSCGIGANDVANSFATSVGAQVLTLRSALVIAAIFELLGAILMGSRVTDTIRKGIVDPDVFNNDIYTLMYGMLCASMATGIWLFIATYFKAPVSTTHSTVGAIMGFAMVYTGENGQFKTGIDWNKVGLIVASWIISPMIAGTFTVILLSFTKYFVLNNSQPVKRGLMVFPFMIWFTFSVICFFVIYKGTPQTGLDDTPLGMAIGISIGFGFIIAICAYGIVKFYLYDKIMNSDDYSTFIFSKFKQNSPVKIINKLGIENTVMETNIDDLLISDDIIIMNEIDIETQSNTSDKKHIFSNSKFTKMELFDPKAEKLYSYLQLVTACVSAFAHGSNDIANSIAPLAAIYTIYRDNAIDSKSDVPLWILAVGGAGIVVGLYLWGWRIIERIGKDLSGVTPSRGFSIELGAAMAVVLASRLEIPVSTTHCQVGSIVGSGLTDSFGQGLRKGLSNIRHNGLPNVDLKVFLKILLAWVVTLPVTMALSATLFSFGYYSPDRV